MRYGVRQEFKTLERQWSTLAATTLQQNAEQGTVAHGRLLQGLKQLRAEVAAASGIASDPDRTTRSLLAIASVAAPAALGDASDLRRYAVDAASKGYLGGDDQMGIVISHGRLQSDLDTIGTALGELSPSIGAPLAPLLRDALGQSAALYSTVGLQLLTAANVKVSGEAMYEAGCRPTSRCASC